jgi:hypothetical protein
MKPTLTKLIKLTFNINNNNNNNNNKQGGVAIVHRSRHVSKTQIATSFRVLGLRM